MLAVVLISLQQRFSNEWNSSTGRTRTLDAVSSRQTKIVCEWLSALGRTDLNIIEVGRGAAWFSPKLARYGRLTAADLADEVLAGARHLARGLSARRYSRNGRRRA